MEKISYKYLQINTRAFFSVPSKNTLVILVLLRPKARINVIDPWNCVVT
jgi:hypothetical protein